MISFSFVGGLVAFGVVALEAGEVPLEAGAALVVSLEAGSAVLVSLVSGAALVVPLDAGDAVVALVPGDAVVAFVPGAAVVAFVPGAAVLALVPGAVVVALVAGAVVLALVAGAAVVVLLLLVEESRRRARRIGLLPLKARKNPTCLIPAFAALVEEALRRGGQVPSFAALAMAQRLTRYAIRATLRNIISTRLIWKLLKATAVSVQCTFNRQSVEHKIA